ncbi:MAG: tRNA 2-selenouridine(34) synthase MnmH [Pseudomonadales bacterium]|nr:tRNA 2-selenouridine(34) synthase MnmH [Pseudomonadales bacterium]MBO6566171.1 tRNA 2-selenouridine(34) synthase MnmH [Pseudomonadales bacterium]MBO6595310.1 tRNA 2-selenouridine(34) synthase MnmH [Pseudomonadales bacterium]MBO6655802.1 tRNA 2-selenouridine(34) synthase MnmH [Pseudomonadales bacterium]MBO6701811.1 tRNA 2-selenouridine(34) synthase MnmH [Pseudomonadales bacterium]
MTSLDLLFRRDVPLIDVRAPVEFHKGAFPSACNLPILSDAEREAVGISYKEEGPEAAAKLGHALVSGDVKETRIQCWATFIEANPESQLYCFRGGQRSQIACAWLRDAGIEVPRIEGGYKKMRHHLIRVFDQLPPLVIVGGKTGTGKTVFLEPLGNAVDLEGIANHRGSAFGKKIAPQPSQIDFENRVAIQFLKFCDAPHVLLEDEGRLIGRIHVPLPLQSKMKASPMILIEETVEIRTQNIYEEYIEQQWQEYQAEHGPEAPARYADYLLGAVDAIKKRLGGVAHSEIRQLMQEALQSGDANKHRAWISRLLIDYYDPMYNYQLSQKEGRIRFRGTADEAQHWYAENSEELLT